MGWSQSETDTDTNPVSPVSTMARRLVAQYQGVSGLHDLGTIPTEKLKVFVEGGEERAAFRRHVLTRLLQEPLFDDPTRDAELSMESKRIKSQKLLRCILDMGLLSKEELLAPLGEKAAWLDAILWGIHLESAVKMGLHFTMFCRTIRNMGSSRHAQFIGEDAAKLKIFGCFALTELSHGSNASGIRTLALYNHKQRSFILHTPDLEATKWWIGNLGETATHAVVFAQLM